jgi:hypothetical protein
MNRSMTMSKLESIRNAIFQLDLTEEILNNVKDSFAIRGPIYNQVDSCFESVGDASTILRRVLEQLEEEALNKMMGA